MISEKVRLADQVTKELQAMIFSNYKPGDRLPVENELAQHFSVSRITIREAISKLSIMGVVDVRQGEGTFIKKLSPSSFMQPMLPMLTLSNTEMSDIFEVRLIIECRAAELAAQRSTPESLSRLKELLELMEQSALCNEIQQYNTYDVQFHKEIARCSCNQVLSVICELITDMIQESIFFSCKTASHIMNSVIYHNRIYYAISEHNAEEASKAMREHLNGALTFVQSSTADDQDSINTMELS